MRISAGVAALVLCSSMGIGAELDVDGRPKLASHEATYSIALIRAAQMEGVRAVSGQMNYTLIDQCDGYTIESDINLSFTFSNGLTNQVSKSYAGWESKDGRTSTFRMRIDENGESEDAYTGRVDLNEDGSGQATYASLDSTTFELPAGSVLSTRQLRDILALGQSGQSLISQTVMDGAFEDGPYRAIGYVAPMRPKLQSDNALLSGGTWPVSLAYFPLEPEAEVPEYELNLQVLENGIIRAMTQDYGAYTLAVQMTGIKPRDGGCR